MVLLLLLLLLRSQLDLWVSTFLGEIFAYVTFFFFYPTIGVECDLVAGI